MDKKEWAQIIKKACEEAGTYQAFFDLVIDQLAGIMETKDTAQKIYEESGGFPVVKYVNKGGHENLRKNPALAIVNECDQQALAYWRDLGLTPSGYKKLGETLVLKKEKSFEDVLKDIGI